MERAALLKALTHIGNIPEDVPQEFEIDMCQNQHIREQGENGMDPEAEPIYNWTDGCLCKQVDAAGQTQHG